MSRATVIINGNAARLRVAKWASSAPYGTRVEFRQTKRSIPQNDRMWAMLTDVAAQKEHCGRKYSPEIWKTLFLHACGREMQFVPTLDGTSFMPLGYRSSELSKQEMSALIDFIGCWGAQNGVVFHDQEAERAA
ncbi:MAG TPA: recombination protein NinB [Pseudolabrys sp.]|nr:recombination protein NinB [Pseudolabrys sp.]